MFFQGFFYFVYAHKHYMYNCRFYSGENNQTVNKTIIPLLIVPCLFAHDPEKERLKWAQYYRIGSVYSESSKTGITGYARLKRTTVYTFKDIRFFGHFFETETEIRIRQKSSRRFLSIDRIYSFNTLIYEKNTFLNVNLRYHFNQGIGWLMRNSESGNMTLEMGIAFDNSDFLNTEQKTSYARGGYSVDYNMNLFSTKFEIDYFYQLSEVVGSSSLSRFQILGELQWSYGKNWGVITGFTQDIQKDNSDPSIFLTISVRKPLNWYF